MKTKVMLVTMLLSVLAALSGAAAKPAFAGMVTASSQFPIAEVITFQNTSATSSADVSFSGGAVLMLLASATGSASASATVTGELQRVDVPELLFSNSYSAPPSQTITVAPQTFSFVIAPSGSVVLSSTDSLTTEATASSPVGSATAIASYDATNDFSNNSSVNIRLTLAVEASTEYTLSLSGVSSPMETGLASFNAVGSVSDELTSNGMRTVPLSGTTTLTLGPGMSLDVTGTTILEAEAAVAPEPGTLLLSLLGMVLLCLVAYIRQLHRSVGRDGCVDHQRACLAA